MLDRLRVVPEAQLGGLQRMLAEPVAVEPMVWGAGFVAAPGVVDGLERYMAWWQRQNTRVTRLRLNFDPRSVDVYDYLQMDWFQLPQRGQARVAYGPYVDYSGSDMYTVTATVPSGTTMYGSPAITDPVDARYAIVGTPTYTLDTDGSGPGLPGSAVAANVAGSTNTLPAVSCAAFSSTA